MVCTETQTSPFKPGVIYTTDTTDVGKLIEVTYDPETELNERGVGFINIGWRTYLIETHYLDYLFSREGAHLGSDSGLFISPDSISFTWNSSPSNHAEYIYGCSGRKIQ